MDVWGPYHLQSLSGAKYFLTFVDDYSRAILICLIQQETQVPSVTASFIAMTQTQFGLQVKSIRIDNATEFCKAILQEK